MVSSPFAILQVISLGLIPLHPLGTKPGGRISFPVRIWILGSVGYLNWFDLLIKVIFQQAVSHFLYFGSAPFVSQIHEPLFNLYIPAFLFISISKIGSVKLNCAKRLLSAFVVFFSLGSAHWPLICSKVWPQNFIVL